LIKTITKKSYYSTNKKLKMKNDFIITSTNNIEGGNIKNYLGVINNNIVIGTNLFSDIGASIIDIFGGTSSSYQKKLKDIYESSIQNLKIKAKNLGANAILGLAIDFDEISGGNKSMFMISVSGTAVTVDYESIKVKRNDIIAKESISLDVLKNELTKKRIIHKVQEEINLSQDEWYFTQQNSISNISEGILNNFLTNYGSFEIPVESEKGKTLINNVTNYFRALEEDEAIKTLYNKVIEKPSIVLNIMQNANIFSADKIYWLINKKLINTAIICLNINKENYSNDECNKMSEILEYFEKLENKGEIKTIKAVLGKSKQKYICPNGHSNSIESTYCETKYNCSQNIKGLTENQVDQINQFKLKVETLKSLLSNK
tara:strand:- start:119 stop:1240 length:1122 start_codon:yes stop_codon:yes gene_type:complete